MCKRKFTGAISCCLFLVVESISITFAACSRLGGCIPLYASFPHMHWCALSAWIFPALGVRTSPNLSCQNFAQSESVLFWQDCSLCDHGSVFCSQEAGIPSNAGLANWSPAAEWFLASCDFMLSRLSNDRGKVSQSRHWEYQHFSIISWQTFVGATLTHVRNYTRACLTAQSKDVPFEEAQVFNHLISFHFEISVILPQFLYIYGDIDS